MNDRAPGHDDLVVDRRHLASPSSAAVIPRMIYGVLYAFTLVIPIAMFIVIRRGGSLLDASGGLLLVRLWALALTLLLIWALVYMKKEPLLARLAFGLVAVLFACATIRVNRVTIIAPPSPAATPLVQKNITPGPKNEILSKEERPTSNNSKAAEALVGRWKNANGDGSMQFWKMGTVVMINEAGESGLADYACPDATQLQLTFKGAMKEPKAYSFRLADNKLTITDAQGKMETLAHVETTSNPEYVIGEWVERGTRRKVSFKADGNFFFGTEENGRWGMNDNLILARGIGKDSSVYRLSGMGGHALAGARFDATGKNIGRVVLDRAGEE